MDSRAERIVAYTILIFFAAVTLYPVASFVLIALSPNQSGSVDLSSLHWGNFATAWTEGGMGHAMLASGVVAVGAVLGQTVLAILSGYGFGVLGVVGQKVIFPIILLGLMISLEAIIVPLYYQFRGLGLTDSWLGLIIIQLGLGVPFGTFWMRATFRAIPRSLVESARLDGASPVRVLWSILMPVAKPAVYTLMLLSFMAIWNDYFLSLVFLSSSDKVTAPVALGAFQGRFTTQFNMLAAAGLIVSLPVLLMYVFFQRKFIAGILSGAIKE